MKINGKDTITIHIKTNYELRVTNYELIGRGFEPPPILELRMYELRIGLRPDGRRPEGRIHPLSPSPTDWKSERSETF
jgi:hypothetical protein